MDGIAAFIAARLDGDEDTVQDKRYVWPTSWDKTLNPARVLREAAALREILKLHSPAEPDRQMGFTYPAAAKFCGYDGPGDTWQADQEPEFFPDAAWPCLTVRLLATIWADHPDYREEWKP